MKLAILTGVLLNTIFVQLSNDGLNNVSKKNVLIDGYDVVSYFENKVEMGKSQFQYNYNNTTLWFSSKAHRDKFASQPENYFPQYGGWCAYAMGNDGSKVSINPKTYLVENGKLYLFYNKLLTNTLNLWKEEGPEV